MSWHRSVTCTHLILLLLLLSRFSRVRLSATPWTAAYQARPSMGFSRQEYWSGVPLPSLSVISGSWQIVLVTKCVCVCKKVRLCAMQNFTKALLSQSA